VECKFHLARRPTLAACRELPKIGARPRAPATNGSASDGPRKPGVRVGVRVHDAQRRRRADELRRHVSAAALRHGAGSGRAPALRRNLRRAPRLFRTVRDRREWPDLLIDLLRRLERLRDLTHEHVGRHLGAIEESDPAEGLSSMQISAIALPSRICFVRAAAAAKSVNASACTPPVVIQAAAIPRASASTISSTAAAGSPPWITTPMRPMSAWWLALLVIWDLPSLARFGVAPLCRPFLPRKVCPSSPGLFSRTGRRGDERADGLFPFPFPCPCQHDRTMTHP